MDSSGPPPMVLQMKSVGVSGVLLVRFGGYVFSFRCSLLGVVFIMSVTFFPPFKAQSRKDMGGCSLFLSVYLQCHCSVSSVLLFPFPVSPDHEVCNIAL